MPDFEGLRGPVNSHGYRPLFVTVSGAHLYGFPSPDSDVDLRGCHLLPLRAVGGLSPPADETVERKLDLAGTEVEWVSHDLGKYLRLLVKNNGYVLEQILSPRGPRPGGRQPLSDRPPPGRRPQGMISQPSARKRAQWRAGFRADGGRCRRPGRFGVRRASPLSHFGFRTSRVREKKMPKRRSSPHSKSVPASNTLPAYPKQASSTGS